MAEYDNICKHLHLPVQSGSDEVLQSMNRGYNSSQYYEKIQYIKEKMPNISLTTDIIAGYPGETQQNHNDTLEMMRKVRYDGAFMFKYSPREGTKAFDFDDDVNEEEKIRRLNEIIELQNQISKENNAKEIGREHIVLCEGPSKRNQAEWKGRTDTNKVVIFPLDEIELLAGDLVKVEIEKTTAATLRGKII